MTLPDGSKLPALADGEYDAIILGTGLKECIISGILSVDGKKVLHMDRNDYYGAESASVNLNQLFEKFKAGTPPAGLGASRDYNIDMQPKFLMANGKLVKMLVMTGVNKYLEFKQVDGSYVLKDGKINKVPATDTEALSTPLVGFFEKRRLRSFVMYVQDYEADKPATHKGYDLSRMTSKELFDKFGLEKGTIDFIGHALALYDNDTYQSQPAIDLVDRCKLYGESLARYGKSPYLYPLYGLGELPQAFARLAAVYGGTYMLNKPVSRIVYNAEGQACGVVSVGEDGKPAFAKCKQIVGDPTYFPEKSVVKGKVVRCIAVLSHPITPGNEASCQIILPQNQIGRTNDIYVFCVSSSHCAAPDGKYIALVSTVSTRPDLESNLSKAANEELKEGLKLLGKVDSFFLDVYDVLEPRADGRADKCFISKSYDATSHFEQTTEDVMDMYERIYGKPLDLSKTMVSLSGDDE
jgi:Rab GDP dissociation inhibitor